MLSIALAFIGGLIIGGMLGVVLVSLMVMGRRQEDSGAAWEKLKRKDLSIPAASPPPRW